MHITLIKPLCLLHKKLHIKSGYPNIVIYNFLKNERKKGKLYFQQICFESVKKSWIKMLVRNNKLFLRKKLCACITQNTFIAKKQTLYLKKYSKNARNNQLIKAKIT